MPLGSGHSIQCDVRRPRSLGGRYHGGDVMLLSSCRLDEGQVPPRLRQYPQRTERHLTQALAACLGTGGTCRGDTGGRANSTCSSPAALTKLLGGVMNEGTV